MRRLGWAVLVPSLLGMGYVGAIHAQAGNEPWTLADDPGDHFLSDVPGTAAPLAAAELSDIRGVRVASEDTYELVLAIKVGPLASPSDPWVRTRSVVYDLEFQIAGFPAYYTARAVVAGRTNPADATAVWADGFWAAVCVSPDVERTRCFVNPLGVNVDSGSDEILVHLVKEMILANQTSVDD